MALLSSRGTVGDEVFGLIKQVGRNPRIINAFFPWGGGFNIHFEPEDQVVEAWKKSGEASDVVIARSTEENRTLENEIKELKDKLGFCEEKIEEVTKEKDEAVCNLNQMQNELEGALKTIKGMENHYQLQRSTLNLNAENAKKAIIQSREKITTLNGELLTSQDDNSQQK